MQVVEIHIIEQILAATSCLKMMHAEKNREVYQEILHRDWRKKSEFIYSLFIRSFEISPPTSYKAGMLFRQNLEQFAASNKIVVKTHLKKYGEHRKFYTWRLFVNVLSFSDLNRIYGYIRSSRKWITIADHTIVNIMHMACVNSLCNDAAEFLERVLNENINIPFSESFIETTGVKYFLGHGMYSTPLIARVYYCCVRRFMEYKNLDYINIARIIVCKYKFNQRNNDQKINAFCWRMRDFQANFWFKIKTFDSFQHHITS